MTDLYQSPPPTYDESYTEDILPSVGPPPPAYIPSTTGEIFFDGLAASHTTDNTDPVRERRMSHQDWMELLYLITGVLLAAGNVFWLLSWWMGRIQFVGGGLGGGRLDP